MRNPSTIVIPQAHFHQLLDGHLAVRFAWWRPGMAARLPRLTSLLTP